MKKLFLAVVAIVLFVGVVATIFNWAQERRVQKIELRAGDLIDLRVQRDAPGWKSGCGVHFSEVSTGGIALLRAHEMPRSVVRVEKVDGDTVVATVVSEPYGELADYICPAGSTFQIDLHLAKEAKYRTPKGVRMY